jgi:uncharacterized protein
MTDIAAAQPAAAAPAEPVAPPRRIATLDIVRGIAVMGILAMNIVAFAMPFQAYMNPVAYGMESGADLASWAFSFVFIDGKMRGLFSFLFGASTLLVIERARASGLSPARVHYARMAWLLVFGLLHFYFIWFGDILSLYALIGLVLFFFRDLSVRGLIMWGIGFVALQSLLFGSLGVSALYLSQAATQPGAPAQMVEGWRSMQEGFAPLAGPDLAHKLALFQGPYAGLVHKRLIENGLEPFGGVLFFGWETLGYMLLGMAALKSGFFRGDWPVARYRKVALIGFGVGVPAYALMAWLLIRSNFSVEMIFALSMGATTPFRPFMIVAIAASIVLLTRNGGALVDRIAAAGRAAFTNYLGTSILMTTLFYGYGLGFYGTMSRVELWLVVVAMWALMLIWSKPWLDRFQYGPFEWLWRSLSRMELQPMRKRAAAGEAI